ncbi:MAG: UDP-N-acetylmuramoyl-L-alanine--D-glutamate ligase [Desulfococcus sp. 4484_241]|nr:MAG: UDP-N-acetylmuramoyl-L-alanine--D-glutamate ligase [Desulfococcus sp. 4484_241]
MDIENKKFVVVGLGRSGMATVRFLCKRGASVVATDCASEQKIGEAAALAREMGAVLELGGHRTETFLSADFVVVSPGVPLSAEPIRKAVKKGVPVIGEIELASMFITKPVAAVTGTNGKTTTATLLGEMLKASGFHVFVGGNIGAPLIGFADKGQTADIVVAEISSFQLDTISTFRPRVAVLLNIAEDHMARYEDFSDYVRSKGRIFENQQEDDTAVINGADFHVLQAAKGTRSKRLMFNAGRSITNGAAIDGRDINILKEGALAGKILVKSPVMRARHNLENISAAALAALELGGTIEGIQTAVDEFQGLPHRLEYVGSIGGVHYFNDSKATNPDAVRRALEFFTSPVVLLMGGEDKGCEYGVLRNVIRECVRAVILIGETKSRIRASINGSVPMWDAQTMEDAVGKAYEIAEPGDAVLLSPACASFDMYESYAHRGDDFCRAVKRLMEAQNGAEI